MVIGLVVGGFSFSETRKHITSNDLQEIEKGFQEEKVVENEDNLKGLEDEFNDKEEMNKEKEENKKHETINTEDGKKPLPNIGDYGQEGHKSSKKVFLTFDDGPTSLTPKILDILKEHDVLATFFVIGKLAEDQPDIVQRTYDEGHMVLPHSYSHDYSIYSTFETFYDDFYRAEEVVENILNIEVPPIFRFPGGSSNHSSFRYGGKQFMPQLTEDIKEKGYYYIDWNVSSGDAGPDYNDKDKMLNNIFQGAKNKDFIVVLCHDVSWNVKMAEILPQVITTLREQGYQFRTFKDITEEELNKMVSLKIANKSIVR